MKSKKIIGGIILIVLAVVLALEAFGVFEPLTARIGKISVWTLLCAAALTIFIIKRLCRGEVRDIFIPLALIFMLFEKNIAVFCGMAEMNIINNWLLLLIAVLFAAGFALIFPEKAKHKGQCCRSLNTENTGNCAENLLGKASVYIDSAKFSPDRVENNLGCCDVYFENPEAYTGGQTLYIENNLGAVTLHIPKAWYAKISAENNLGSVHAPKKDSGLLLYIKGENNLGSVNILYI